MNLDEAVSAYWAVRSKRATQRPVTDLALPLANSVACSRELAYLSLIGRVARSLAARTAIMQPDRELTG